MLEFIDELDEMKGRINEVEWTFNAEFMTVMNRTTAALHKKDKTLEASIDALKLEVLELKRTTPTKPRLKPRSWRAKSSRQS